MHHMYTCMPTYIPVLLYRGLCVWCDCLYADSFGCVHVCEYSGSSKQGVCKCLSACVCACLYAGTIVSFAACVQALVRGSEPVCDSIIFSTF